MNSDIETLQTIPDGKPVRIFLPLAESDERVRAHGVYQMAKAPIFRLAFKPGVLPLDLLDPHQACIISIDMGGPTLTLEAMVRNIINSQTLEMIVNRSISHEQMREYFRVDAVTDLVASSYMNRLLPQKKEPWSLAGTTIDMSGSGVLAVFTEKPPEDRQVLLKIELPSSPRAIVEVVSHPVRTKELQDGRYEVAYHFDDIKTEDRDLIIGCCLVMQRKLLRLKVQVKNN